MEHIYGGDWSQLPWRATAGCARSLLDDDGTVGVHCGQVDDGSTRAYFSGIRRCGSVWLCPVCTATIRAHRADEVGAICAAHAAAGGRQSMLTLTVRHHRDTPLVRLYDAIREAYRGLQQSAVWRGFRLVMTGQTVTVESTLGDNGFHVHLHILLLWEPGRSDGQHRRVMRALKLWGPHAWANRVENRLGERPSDERGFHVMDIPASSARYVAKITGEVTRGDYKTRDALEVMLSGVVAGDSQASARYTEWAEVMPGKRMIRFSPGLRERYLGDTPELTEQQIVDQDRKLPLVGQLGRSDYLGLMVATKSRPIPAAARFLGTVEQTGTHPLLVPVDRSDGRPLVPLGLGVHQSRGLGESDGTPNGEGPWRRSARVLDLLATRHKWVPVGQLAFVVQPAAELSTT